MSEVVNPKNYEDDEDFDLTSVKRWRNVQQRLTGKAPEHISLKISRTSDELRGSKVDTLKLNSKRRARTGTRRWSQPRKRSRNSASNFQMASAGNDDRPSQTRLLPPPPPLLLSFPPLPSLSLSSVHSNTTTSYISAADPSSSEVLCETGAAGVVYSLHSDRSTCTATGNTYTTGTQDPIPSLCGSGASTRQDAEQGCHVVSSTGLKRPSTDSGVSLSSFCASLDCDLEEKEEGMVEVNQLSSDSQMAQMFGFSASPSQSFSGHAEDVRRDSLIASTSSSTVIGTSLTTEYLHRISSVSETRFEVISASVGSGPKKQASLLSFLPGFSRRSLSDEGARGAGVSFSKQTGSLPQVRANRPHPAPLPRSQSVSRPPFIKQPSASHKAGCKACPSYKRVPGIGFVVDAFSYGSIPGCTGYFLSHFHSDHYQGLNRHFRHIIYCSQVTANLVRHNIRVPGESLHPLPLNKPCLVRGVEVTLLDANHCPGSVMFLFKLPSGKNYLHSGDFRFCKEMKLYPQLVGCPIHHLFLDTTYCSPQHSFPPQSEVVEFAVHRALTAVRGNPRTLIVCGTYTIGKERVFLAIAEALGSKVCVSREKKAILDCLESARVSRLITTDPHLASVHVLPMGKLSIENLSGYLERWRPEYTSLIAFRPTGWTHSSKHLSLDSIRPQARGSVTIYGIPYSEHSSFPELRSFVQFLQPEEVIPTVPGGEKHMKEMERHFSDWLSPSCVMGNSWSSTESRIRQTTIDSAFK